ncbi:MAG: NAD+ synthase [Candidatus Omnitrophica bacterium]|nr:NAD+ synthase [Candidatus Omnitrophota bacterium]
MNKARVAVSQINTTVGDLRGNTEKILFCMGQAVHNNADLIIFPELAVTGYPPEDLLLRPNFIKENLRCIDKIRILTEDIIAIVGFVDRKGNSIYNSAAVISNRKIFYIYHKMHLPNYGVFDEKRYFVPGDSNRVLKTKGFSFVVNICEDIWNPADYIAERSMHSAHFMVNISASPYCMGKIKERQRVLIGKANRLKIPVLYCNLIGGQDELVFDGRSLIFDKRGKLIAKAKAFEEDLLMVDLPIDAKRTPRIKGKTRIIDIPYKTKEERKDLPGGVSVKEMDRIEEVYYALVLGVRDYARKNNFSKVTFGLSGGIDSALVACIAVKALGRANVLAVSMPSQYSSKGTQDDAEHLSRNLGIRFVRIPIDSIFDEYNNTLAIHFTGMKADITEENMQARIRGNILMAFSNKFGYLVLNTGNKSETSVGYCTLYGDMAGGFAVVKDVPKNLVYELARFINKIEGKEIIPKAIFKRPPSAELRPNQKDQDSLPSYEMLDEIIDLYIEKDKAFSDIVKKVRNKGIVKGILRMIDINEYKRRQSPPGIKITPRAFGKDRRMPITNKFNSGD